MKTVITILFCSCLTAGWLAMADDEKQTTTPQTGSTSPDKPKQDNDDSTKLASFMRKKLESSNKILEGLVIDDLTLVTKGADELLEMSNAEGWRASNDMMYLQHSREFRSSVDVMRSKAEKNSIDGAALAWVEMTMNCIHCHEWVRDAMLVDTKVSLRNTDKLATTLAELVRNHNTK